MGSNKGGEEMNKYNFYRFILLLQYFPTTHYESLMKLQKKNLNTI